MNHNYYTPDINRLKKVAGDAVPASLDMTRELLAEGGELSLEELASLLHAVLSGSAPEIEEMVQAHAAQLRSRLFGNWVIPMAPVEISNACASDCIFCGWRVSNRAMKRLRLPVDLVLMQVEYLVGLGIHYIELVSGDDIKVVRQTLPALIQGTKEIFRRHGVTGKVNFCTLALTEAQYAELKAAGADSMIVWQEAYDPDVYRKHVLSGPKAAGISDEWKPVQNGDGWRFRVESQERALRAGIEVAIGSMLGLNPDLVTEFLAVVDHARYLIANYGASPEHPIIIGMPIWNPITTPETDNRPGGAPNLSKLFPSLTALYLLALPSNGSWIFPNCRVPLRTQIHAAQIAGVFSSTEVKLGPGGYLPSVIRHAQERGEDTSELQGRIAELLRESGDDVSRLAELLDQREQFVHHYHSHATYRKAMESAGLALFPGVCLPDEPGEELTEGFLPASGAAASTDRNC